MQKGELPMNESNSKLIHPDVTASVLQEIIDTPEKLAKKIALRLLGVMIELFSTLVCCLI
jgi:hypothetical protein